MNSYKYQRARTRRQTYLLMTFLLLLETRFAAADGGLPSTKTHQVGIGDSIERISKKYPAAGDNQAVLFKLNPHLRTTGLQVGDVLFVPDGPQEEDKLANEIRLPPPPQIRPAQTPTVIAGRKSGLVQIYINGRFALFPASAAQAYP